MVFDTLSQLEMYIPVLPAIRLIADIMDHDDLYEKAPANLEVRNARAYLHSWRGRPRQAQEEFRALPRPWRDASGLSSRPRKH